MREQARLQVQRQPQQVNSQVPDTLDGPVRNDALNFNVRIAQAAKELEVHIMSRYPGQEPIKLRSDRSFLREGGSDPLDFIYVFRNEGAANVPKHWHYIGLGLSDIHGYRLTCALELLCRGQTTHPQWYPPLGTNQEALMAVIMGLGESGFGFEFTFRVKCNDLEGWPAEPPVWPALRMQQLAKYIFQTKNIFNDGDHVAWDSPLDDQGDSMINQMLMMTDPELQSVSTNLGRVSFLQIVGICEEELRAVREWNSRGILKLMSRREDTGGPCWVTDMTRGLTIFEIEPEYRTLVENAVEEMGSDLTIISAEYRYSPSEPKWYRDTLGNLPVNMGDYEDLAELDYQMQQPVCRAASRMSYESEGYYDITNCETAEARILNSVYLLLNEKCARVLPVAIRRILPRKKHFSFNRFNGKLQTTLVPAGYPGESLVSAERPYVKQGPWLQIYISDRLLEQMIEQIPADIEHDLERAPRSYSFPEFNFYITIAKEIGSAERTDNQSRAD